MLKKCTICKQDKPLNEFHRNKRKKSGYNSWCKPCTKEYKDRHYRENKAAYVSKARAATQRTVDWVSSLKEGKPCVDCGEVFPPVCMDFDHIGTDKQFGIAEAARRFGRSKILKEIEKCELVCSNCHRVRTRDRLSSLGLAV